MLLVIAGCLFVGIALVAFTLFDQFDERVTIRSSLRQLQGYEVENLRDQEMLKPVTTRVLTPALEGVIGLGRRFTPAGYVDKARQRLLVAGKAGPDEVDRFLAVRVITIAVIPVVALFWLSVVTLSPKMRVLSLLLLIMCLVLGPDAVLNRKVQARQNIIRRTLPDILDLLTISVEAGLGFEQALDRTIASVPGPLSDEFTRMLNEVRAGSSRSDAMRAVEQRTDVPEVRSFVLAILQADTFGVSIGRILRAQADEMRIKRRQLAQERAMKAPVKMLIPMVFCIFPALFIVVLGPAIINTAKNFK